MTDSQTEYSGRLAAIRQRLRASKSISTDKLRLQLTESIEKNDHQLHIGKQAYYTLLYNTASVILVQL